MASSSLTNPKRCVTLDKIRTGIGGKMCIIEHESGCQISAIKNDTEHVYIYEKKSRKDILCMPAGCQVQCMCILQGLLGVQHLLFGLRNGQVIYQRLPQFNKEVKTKRKQQKKNKHSKKPSTSVYDGTGVEDSGHSQGIFRSLLSNGEIKLSSALSSPKAAKNIPADNVTILDGSHILLNEARVQDVIAVHGCLVTCAECTEGWTLSAYQPAATSHPAAGEVTSSYYPSAQVELVFEASPYMKTFLPRRNMALTYSGCQLARSKHREDLPIALVEREAKPQLFCVISLSMATNLAVQLFTPENILTLEENFFNNLFGTDNNLLDIPVILVCLPDGRIYQSPLSTNRTRLDGISSEPCSLELFYALNQPVTTIHGFTLEYRQGEINGKNHHHGACSCVCIIGQRGKVVQITPKVTTNDREKLQFTEFYIHSDLRTACKRRTLPGLLYATDREVHCLSLENPTDGSGKCPTVRKSMYCSSAIGNITAIADIGRASTDSSQNALLVLTSSGQILQLYPTPDVTDRLKDAPITAGAAGKRLQDSLRTVDAISRRSSNVSQVIERQDRILREMSQACHVAVSLLDNCSESRDSSVFQVDIDSIFRYDGDVRTLELSCRLANHSPWCLSHGWSFLVTVTADPDQRTSPDHRRYHTTKSVPLVYFQPNQTMSVIVPVQYGKTTVTAPISVQCLLHFSPNYLLSSLLSERNTPNVKSDFLEGDGCIFLPIIAPRVIDLLTVLHQEDQVPLNLRATSELCVKNRGSDWLTSRLQGATLSNERTGLSEVEANHKSVSVCAKLNRNLCSQIVQLGNNRTRCTPSEYILQWLFNDNKFMSLSSQPQRYCLTPNGQVVTFDVNDQSSTSAREAGKEMLDIAITVPDSLTLCQIVFAVNRRIKIFLERDCPGGAGISSQSTLQTELTELRNFQTKLLSIQDNVALQDSTVSLHWKNIAVSTLDVYQKIRSQSHLS